MSLLNLTVDVPYAHATSSSACGERIPDCHPALVAPNLLLLAIKNDPLPLARTVAASGREGRLCDLLSFGFSRGPATSNAHLVEPVLYSLNPDLTVAQLIAEYELTPHCAYMQRAQQAQNRVRPTAQENSP
jgi:hypothetical protein